MDIPPSRSDGTKRQQSLVVCCNPSTISHDPAKKAYPHDYKPLQSTLYHHKRNLSTNADEPRQTLPTLDLIQKPCTTLKHATKHWCTKFLLLTITDYNLVTNLVNEAHEIHSHNSDERTHTTAVIQLHEEHQSEQQPAKQHKLCDNLEMRETAQRGERYSEGVAVLAQPEASKS